jgi:phenylalanyl-tRNA synthetase beta chain
MRVNLEWLREWVELDLDPAVVAEQLTIAGLEVDSVEPAAPESRGLIVAEVTDVQPHPNADRLTVCTVSDGRQQHSVVCGAPNVCNGLRTAFAPVGAVLPGDHEIKPVELRGVPSNGMLCSAKELGLAEEPEGLLELDAQAPLGRSLHEYLRLDDAILDIDLTPNRGDCFSVLGVARETAAINGVPLQRPAHAPVAPGGDETFPVELQAPDGCPRFVGRVIRNVATGRVSPLWLRERLRRAGLRAIHPIVDVTNYVMLELGQPLHSYDLTKVTDRIIVRYAQPEEELLLLDGRRLTLQPDVLVIADSSGAIGLAGIMGGQSTAVETTTTDVFLEAAYFVPKVIAGRPRRFGLHTDASLRFERGVDPEHQLRAIERATTLLIEIAGGDPGPSVETKNDAQLPRHVPVTLREARLERILGLAIATDTVESILRRLEMRVERVEAGWRVTPPGFRFDISIEEDLIEEVGRMAGYDSIPVVAERHAGHLGSAAESRVAEDRFADLLTARGYSEVVTYSFIDRDLELAVNPGADPVALANPISQDMGVMRRSLWPGLLRVAAQNLSRQRGRVRIFEIGGQFRQGPDGVEESSVLAGLATGPQWPEQWDGDQRDVDFFDAKADIEAMFEMTGLARSVTFERDEHPALSPGQCARIRVADAEVGWLGVLHPALQQRLELKKTAVLFTLRMHESTMAKIPAFKPYSKFPSVRRDIAIVLNEDVSAAEVLSCIETAAGELLQDITVFDIYRGKGIDSRRKSLALGLILQDTSRTLTDADADRAMAAVTVDLQRALGATIRS